MKKFVKAIILVTLIVVIYAVVTMSNRAPATPPAVTNAVTESDKVQEVAKDNGIPPNSPAVLAVASQEAAKAVVTESMKRCNALKRLDPLWSNILSFSIFNRTSPPLKLYLDKAVALSESPEGVLEFRAVKDNPTDFCNLKAGDATYLGCNFVYPSLAAATAQCGTGLIKLIWDPRVVA